METKKECINILRRKGFTEDFLSARSFCVRAVSKRIYRPHEVKISGFYECIEEQEEKDRSVVFAIETNDGKKGILIANTGESMADQISEFIHVVNLARRRNKKLKFLQTVQWLFKFKFSTNL